jgi:hypothetical protein
MYEFDGRTCVDLADSTTFKRNPVTVDDGE